MTRRTLGAAQREILRKREKAELLVRDLVTAAVSGRVDVKVRSELEALGRSITTAREAVDVEECIRCGASVVISMPPRAAFAIVRCTNLHLFEEGNAVPNDRDFGEEAMHLVWCAACAPAVIAAELAQRVDPVEELPAEPTEPTTETDPRP